MNTVAEVAAAESGAEAQLVIEAGEGTGMISQTMNALSTAVSSEARVITSREARLGMLFATTAGYVTGAKVVDYRRSNGKDPILNGWVG
jgi:hypothetical protein